MIKSVVVSTSKGQHMTLEEVKPGKMELGQMFQVVFEDKDDDGETVYTWDTACCVITGFRKPNSSDHYKGLMFMKLQQTYRFSLMPAARFYGPLNFEVETE